MKRYPKALREQWPSLLHRPFDPDGELAQSFLRYPRESWNKLKENEGTALGWAVRNGTSYAGTSAEGLAWVKHLLGAGALLHHPLFGSRSPHHSYYAETFWYMAWAERGSGLLEVAQGMGLPLFSKSRFVSFSRVVAKQRMDWVVAFLDQHGGGFGCSIEDACSPLISPAFLLELLPELRRRAVPWSSLPQGHCLTRMWELALRHPDQPLFLTLAKEAWDELSPTEPPAGWGTALGSSLVTLGSGADVSVVRRALEERLPDHQRADWAPQLPCLKQKSSLAGASARQWRDILTLVEWATAWGIPPRQRDNDGVPWGLAILREAYENRNRVMSEFPMETAWKALELLIVHGHVTTAKPLTQRLSAKARRELQQSSLWTAPSTPASLFSRSSSVKAFLTSATDAWQFDDWRKRYPRALRMRRLTVVTEPVWQQAQAEQPAPRRSSPRF